MSTTIASGLEIRRLAWKDDSFKQADHAAGLFFPVTGLPAGMLGWWDSTVGGGAGNAITFSNGIVTTYGAMNTNQSTVITNGDEVSLPASVVIEKDFPEGVPAANVNSFRVRVKTRSAGTSVLTITPLDVTLSPIASSTVTVTVNSTNYLHFLVGINPTSDIWGIRLSCTSVGVVIDYVTIATCEYINQGGESFNVVIPKRTISQTVPNSFDIIRQLGITSRSLAVIIPLVTTDTYRWLEDKSVNAIPMEIITPTQQATGYISDLKRHSEAGWVGVPLPTTDFIEVPAIAQQLYDISFSLIKADAELNLDTTATPCSQNPGTFTWSISLNPANVTLSVSSEPTTTPTNVMLVLLSGTATPVTLSAFGLPSGTTVTFGTNPVTPNGTSVATIHVTSTPVGTWHIGIKGDDGTVTHIAYFTLVINNSM